MNCRQLPNGDMAKKEREGKEKFGKRNLNTERRERMKGNGQMKSRSDGKEREEKANGIVWKGET